MLYRHVFGTISSEFCGILHVFVNFAGSQIYLKFVAPQPDKISEAQKKVLILTGNPICWRRKLNMCFMMLQFFRESSFNMTRGG